MIQHHGCYFKEGLQKVRQCNNHWKAPTHKVIGSKYTLVPTVCMVVQRHDSYKKKITLQWGIKRHMDTNHLVGNRAEMSLELIAGSLLIEFTSERWNQRKKNINQVLREAGLITKGHKSPCLCWETRLVLDLTGKLNNTRHILDAYDLLLLSYPISNIKSCTCGLTFLLFQIYSSTSQPLTEFGFPIQGYS